MRMESLVKHKITAHGVNGNVPNVNLNQTRQRPIWPNHWVYCGKTKSGGGGVLNWEWGSGWYQLLNIILKGRGEKNRKRGGGVAFA